MKLLQKITQSKTFGLQFFMMGRFAGMLLVSVLLAKSSLWMSNPISTYEIGQYELFLFIAGFINFFWVNALVRGMLGHVETQSRAIVNQQVTQVFYLFGALSMAFTVLFLIAQFGFSLFENKSILIIGGATLYSLLWTPSMLLEYTFILRKESLPLYLSGFITPLFFVFFALGGAIITQSIEGVIIGTLFFAASRFIATSFSTFSPGFHKPDYKWIKRFIIFSSPLLLSAIIAESGIYIDGIIVNSLFDEQVFAVFRYGARELPLNTIMALGLSNAMIPMLVASTNPNRELSELKHKTKRLLYILVPISTLFLIFSDWIFIHVFNESFKESAIVFDVYLLLVVPRLLLPQTIIVGFKRHKLLIWVSILEIITNVTLSVWWGIWWGIFGIAMATLCSFAVEKIVMITLTRKYINIPASKYIPVKSFVVFALIITAVFVIKYLVFV
ncbi:MAG: polysaccharide biosynthesis C-terminal domain-containing protein [Salinivirgaceae bacterium]|nr:polysaccharide biosynthesis C-terminal domain-containing protein [Salinivirgaceae bacterium]MDD4748289.1 polysaccharide biosynthesis C-terminal domain-containing protein [Salinivirgaceae bacterium]